LTTKSVEDFAKVAKKSKAKLSELFMEDILWIVVTIAFFALSIAYVRFCERVK